MSSPRFVPLALSTCAVSLSCLVAAPSWAEPPMNVDDAGTLDQGGMKVEGAWRKDDQTRGPELVFGFSPLENLEVGISLMRDRDHSADPATRLNAVGLGFKWVPIQNDTGWSLGATLDFGNTRVTDYVTPDRYTDRETSLNALATWRAETGHTLHLNLGATRGTSQGQTDTLGNWGAGYEYPLAEQLKLTLEVFGAERGRPDKAIGLRYEIVDGLKVSAALGRGNDRNFAQVGFAWEF